MFPPFIHFSAAFQLSRWTETMNYEKGPPEKKNDYPLLNTRQSSATSHHHRPTALPYIRVHTQNNISHLNHSTLKWLAVVGYIPTRSTRSECSAHRRACTAPAKPLPPTVNQSHALAVMRVSLCVCVRARRLVLAVLQRTHHTHIQTDTHTCSYNVMWYVWSAKRRAC